MRRGATAGAIGVLVVMVGGIGVAAAANGGSLTLGHSNTSSKTTTLTDTKGVPLSLVGPTDKQPLKVNSRKQVTHLNASLLGGKSAAELGTHGSGAQTPTDSIRAHALSTSPSTATEVATTATLAAGTYFVTASAETYETSGTLGTFCFVGPDSDYSDALQISGSSTEQGYATLSETLTVTLTSSQPLGEYCYTNDSSAQYYDGGIIAIAAVSTTSGSAS
jgi:hypothetical protein